MAETGGKLSESADRSDSNAGSDSNSSSDVDQKERLGEGRGTQPSNNNPGLNVAVVGGQLSESDDKSDSIGDFSSIISSFKEQQEQLRRGIGTPPPTDPSRFIFTPPKDQHPPRPADDSENFFVEFYEKNRSKVTDYNDGRLNLLKIFTDINPFLRTKLGDWSLVHLVEKVRETIEDYKTKFNRLNLPLQDVTGIEISTCLQKHHQKVMDVINEYEKKLNELQRENDDIKLENGHLNAELTAFEIRMQRIFGIYVEDPGTTEEFMAELKSRVAYTSELNSTLLEHLSHKDAENSGLRIEVANLSRQMVESEENSIQEIMNLSQKLEFNEMLEEAVKSKIDAGKGANTEDCKDAIEEWKKKISEVIDENEKELHELYTKVDNQNNELASLSQNIHRRLTDIESLKRVEAKARSTSDNHLTEISKLTTQNNEMKQALERLQNESYALSRATARVSSSRQGASNVEYATPSTVSPARMSALGMRSASSPRKGLRPSQTMAETSSRAPVYAQQTAAPRTGGLQTSRSQRQAMGRTGNSQRWNVSSMQPTAVRQMIPRDNIFLAWDQQYRSVQE